MADAGAGSDWKLIWSDEFSGPAGSAIDTGKWAFDQGGDGWGSQELENYTARTDNAALDGQGNLVITAKRENFAGNQYTSAQLKTLGVMTFTYGRVEGRMQVPAGQGLWPALWMLGEDFETRGWPDCGEVDIMENIGREPNLVHGTMHGPGYFGAGGLGRPYTFASPVSADFHVFALEWEPEAMRWYADGALYSTQTPEALPPGARWVFDHPFFLILNLAVGGGWPKSPDGSTSFPKELVVDYVRVYQK